MVLHQHAVLVVEDEDAIRELIVECLEEDGFAVVAAADGLDAIRRIDTQRGSLCVILLDLMLPGLSGVDIIHHLRQQGAAMRIVAMSASRQHLAEAIRAGADFAVAKPFDIYALLSVLKRQCSHPSEQAVHSPVSLSVLPGEPAPAQ